MNTKKSKHKKPNKPANPNPPQKLVTKSDETQAKCEKTEEIVEIQPESEVKDQIPKIGEVVEQVSEIKVEDTPKKPKRNKGKKKKELDDFEKEELIDVPKELDIPIQESVKEIVTEKEEEKDPLDEVIIPSVRKKKNKKKNQEKNTEKPINQDEETEIPSIESSEFTPKVTEKIDSEIQELFSPKPETPREKKKKNKKKKRNDSEKSDKSEEVSCISAFQQLLAQDENTKEVQNAKNVIDSQESTLINVQDVKEMISEVKIIEELKDIIVDEALQSKIPKEEGKFKKKNKKDKKHSESIEVPLPIPIDKSMTGKELPPPLLSDDLKPVSEPIEKVLEAIEKELSPKPKAKIAKPVEKKRKGKSDVVAESECAIEIDKIKPDSKQTEAIVEEMELKSDVALIPDESCIPEETAQEPITLLEVDKISTTDNKLEKKRKKSPKPPKIKETGNFKNLLKNQLVTDIAKSESIETVTPILISDSIAPDVHTTLELTKDDIKPERKIEERAQPSEISSTESEELQKEQKSELELPYIIENKLDDEGFETKISKKKKKIPKLPIQLDESLKSLEPVSETKVQEKGKIIEENVGVPLDVSYSSELEVRSVRTDESENSTCNATPEVFFIRSSSELFDNNNNTTIQELTNVEGTKLNDLTIPLIEGSGETPIPTPELIASGIAISEFEITVSTEEKIDEKTDLKSKMIEVNQDMEELRLSIEKSLAEFTALDKDEQEMKKERDNKSPLMIKPSKTEKKKQCVPAKENIILAEILKDTPIESNIKQNKSPSFNSPVEKVKPTEPLIKENVEILEAKKDLLIESGIKETEKPSSNPTFETSQSTEPPVCPTRKDNKGKGKSKKKGKQEVVQTSTTIASDPTSTQDKDHAKEKEKSEKKSETQERGKQKANVTDTSKDNNDKKEKSENKAESQEKGKQKSNITDDVTDTSKDKDDIGSTWGQLHDKDDFEPIENFEDALTSSIDDVNKTFELIAEDAVNENVEFQKKLAANKPEINITMTEDNSTDTKTNEKEHPVSQPKNLLGHYDIPVQSNKTDYKKEKNKTPNARQAKVKIKDSTNIDKKSKESQTDTKTIRKFDKSVKESFSKINNDNEEYVYKYSFRKVFLQSACHICNKDLSQIRVPCGYCNLVFYCSIRHKDEDWPQHQALCFAVSTLAHMKDQKHIYADAQNTTGQDYRLLRMQMIVSSEKVLKRRLVPWEQEAMLYPRLCADVACREWKQGRLKDCEGCAQLSHCSDHPEHLPKSHQRWCKSYSLYQKLVTHQQTKGRLEPKLPTKVMSGPYEIPTKMNEVLAAMYEEKIDMNDIQYAALTQVATAPLTTAYCLQLCLDKAGGNTNGVYKKQTFTIHVVGAELQFEADALNKWEVFFLHLKPEVQELKVVLISKMLNPGNLPLDLLAKIKLCENCRQNERRVVFSFEDQKNYFDYRTSEDFINPDIICAFNPSIQRSSVYNGKDPWPASISSIIKLKTPFIVSSYTLNELRKDIARIKQCTDHDMKLILEPGFNNFASVRPDRNFISDDEMPLLFKNYCVAVVLGC